MDRILAGMVKVATYESCGMDVCGPFPIKNGCKTEKVWVLLLTCARYRAVHLETLDTMSTESLMMAITRFLARNPRPRLIRSDNGGNFTQANMEIRRLMENVDAGKMRKQFDTIEWSFTPPYSPNRMGFCERMIGLAKDGMKAVIPV